MDTFEYITVFISIVLGLGLTYLIIGVGKLLGQWKYYQFYWLHYMQIFITFLVILTSWWTTYSWVGIKDLTFWHFFFLMCSPFVVVLASSLLFPSGKKKKTKILKEHYFSISRPYYILISLFFPLDIVDSLLKGTQHLFELGGFYIIITILSFVFLFSAAFYRKPLYHGFVLSFIIIELVIAKLKFNPTLESLI
jgi:hypothetical protein